MKVAIVVIYMMSVLAPAVYAQVPPPTPVSQQLACTWSTVQQGASGDWSQWVLPFKKTGKQPGEFADCMYPVGGQRP